MTPAVMGGIGIGSSILSGIVGGIGASTSADATASAYTYKAGIAKLNADIASQNAAWAINAGGAKSVQYGLKAGQAIADTKVIQARSGLDVNSGSSVAVRDTQSDVAKYDQGIIRADAAHTAYGYEVEGEKDKAEASMDLASADNAQKAGKLGVLSSILGAGSSVASKWSQGNTLGMWSSTPGPVGSFSSGGNDGAAPSWST